MGTWLKIIFWLILFFPVGIYLIIKKNKAAPKNNPPQNENGILSGQNKNEFPKKHPVKNEGNTTASVVENKQTLKKGEISDELKDVYSEFQELELSIEEKVCLLIGFVALYGDGKFSKMEIHKLREFLTEMNFAPKTLIHRDPWDQELCLDEKLAWILGTIKNNFKNTEKMTSDLIVRFFEVCSISLVNDLSGSKNKTEQRQYLEHVKSLLMEIAKVDGEISSGEKELIKAFSTVTMPSFASKFLNR